VLHSLSHWPSALFSRLTGLHQTRYIHVVFGYSGTIPKIRDMYMIVLALGRKFEPRALSRLGDSAREGT